MLKLMLLLLTLSGFQALPIAAPRQLPDGRRHAEPSIPDSFRQGTEPSRRVIVDLSTGLVQEYVSEMQRRASFIPPPLGNGHGEMERRHWLTDEIPVDVPAQRNGGGWVRVEDLFSSNLPEGFSQETEPMISNRPGFRQGTEPVQKLPDGFRQGTEPFRSIPDGFRQGTKPFRPIPDGFRQGTEPFRPIPDGFRQGTEPFRPIPDGFRQGTEPFRPIPDGFRQGTEPFRPIPDGFRQGTELFRPIPDGFRQGTEPFRPIPDGFRQGTEPFRPIPDGFRQGTEPFRPIPDGFRQGTEPFRPIPDGFRQGTEPFKPIPDGFRQGTEPSTPRQQTCKGEVIDGRCYEFNPTPMSFEDAQASCKGLAPNAELSSITSNDLHARLVSLVTSGGDKTPVLTWLGGRVKNQQASWIDGSEWSYSDWMPGHPNIHTDKPVCVEMFKIDQSWWTAADCELKRASICSYLISA